MNIQTHKKKLIIISIRIINNRGNNILSLYDIFSSFVRNLYIDKDIYEEYYNKTKKLSDKYNMSFENDTFDDKEVYIKQFQVPLNK